MHCGPLGHRVCFNKADLFHVPQEKWAGSSSLVSTLRPAVIYPVNEARVRVTYKASCLSVSQLPVGQGQSQSSDSAAVCQL